jgi:hypothetical protein
MDRDLAKPALILGICITLGLGLAGFFVARAVESAKRFDRYVTVKGLAERDVPADLAIWPISFRVMENDLTKLQDLIQKTRSTVYDFLTAAGFETKEISNSPPQITDFEARGGMEDKSPRTYRYMAYVTVLLRSSKVPLVKETMEKSDKLVQSGVVLTSSDYESRPQFIFTSLNRIKPGMIEEANVNARKAADQFAKDSGSRVGTIRRAIQGPFQINDRDPSSQDMKIIRVVTTIDYFLE